MRIENLSKEIEMTAVRGGNSQTNVQGNASGADFGSVSMINGGTLGLVGPINAVTYSPEYTANQANLSTQDMTQTINKAGVGLLGSTVFVV